MAGVESAKIPVYLDDGLVQRAQQPGQGTARMPPNASRAPSSATWILRTSWPAYGQEAPTTLSEDESLEFATREVHTMRLERAAPERK